MPQFGTMLLRPLAMRRATIHGRNMDTKPPTKLTLIVNNDEAALSGRQAFVDLKWNMRAMVPNLLAMLQGSGRPDDLVEQILHVADAIEEASRNVAMDDIHAELSMILQTAMPAWNGSERRTTPMPVRPIESSTRL